MSRNDYIRRVLDTVNAVEALADEMKMKLTRLEAIQIAGIVTQAQHFDELEAALPTAGRGN